MTPQQGRLGAVILLVACSALLVIFPVKPSLSTEMLFEDEVDARIRTQSVSDDKEQLILRIRHDDGSDLTNNLTRVQMLITLEQEALSGLNASIAWDGEHTSFQRIVTPFSIWSDAFASRNRSLTNATKWADVLQPVIEGGWCGNGSTPEEQAAFEASMLMIPGDANLGVACPAFPGASASQAPAADELIWIIWLKSDEEIVDWGDLDLWAQKISASTEFEASAVGVNMLFAKSKEKAEHDLRFVLIPSFFILIAILAIGLKDPVVAGATVSGVMLVIGAEIGTLSAIGYDFSIIDMVALPIIVGVAVDGAFWYSRSSREREEVRGMLLVAMLTTVAAVSLALFSPIRAQRSLGFIMAIGIILSWVLNRFILEEFYLSRRGGLHHQNSEPLPHHRMMNWGWPVVLVLLASVAFFSPSGVEVLDVRQFLPDDDPALAEMEELQSRYVLASSTIAWIVVDAAGDSPTDYNEVLNLQRQLGQHPSVIKLDTGISLSPLVIGISENDDFEIKHTIDSVATTSGGSIMFEDGRLQSGGVTTGVAIAVLIDGQNADSALQFKDDVRELLSTNGLSGDIGGDLVTGAALARAFDETRVTQILGAGFVIGAMAMLVLRSPLPAARIAIGTVAVGAAVDGMTGFMGGRGFTTGPAVLLGMGFAADYLSHASAGHAPTRKDMSARWWAAITSISVFVLLGLATFPPAQDSGRILTICILFSVLVATALSVKQLYPEPDSSDE